MHVMEYPKRNGICYDPVEDTEAYKKAIKQIEEELDECMKGVNGMGNCHIYWSRKKELLAKVRVEWRSARECNPFIMFD